MRAMWMMGYSDGGDFNMADSFNGRKLRPLVPRPVSSTNNSSTISRFHGDDIFSLNHHLGSTFGDQNKLMEFNTPPVVVSSRWNPTPEQLRTLEELYQRGTRTPSADQIQHITTQLRRYGKIEGKNVFYWFQNHKARERQKRRRQMESSDPDHHENNNHHHHHHHDIEIIERKDAGASKTAGYQVIEQNKNNWLPSSTNCSSLAEEPVSMQRAAKAAALADCRAAGGSCGWIHLEEEELQQRRSFVERNATWQMMHLSSPPSPFMNTTSSTTKTLSALRTLDPAKHSIKPHHDLNVFIAPNYRENGHGHGFNCLNALTNEEEEDGCGESHTLELFPLRGGDDSESNLEKGTGMSAADIDANFTPYQFFEFLPLKN